MASNKVKKGKPKQVPLIPAEAWGLVDKDGGELIHFAWNDRSKAEHFIDAWVKCGALESFDDLKPIPVVIVPKKQWLASKKKRKR